MRLSVNGRPQEVPDGASLAELLALLGHGPAPRGVAVALNGEVVTRHSWNSTTVTERDRVEVLGAAQGG